jgi:hypothetical protein
MDPKSARNRLGEVFEYADKFEDSERRLIGALFEIDDDRLFVKLGYKSLRSFCVTALGISRTQAQRLVTQVRRIQTTFDIGAKDSLAREH